MDENQLTVAEAQPPQQLITIEPAKYVELVFEPFAKRLADAKTLAEAAQFDVTTTAGMAVAVKHRATFRDIRVASEKARKERKAPILEIGKLLDSRQKEIEAEIEPFESRFDDAIKAEEARKEAEKSAKLAVERERVNGIRAKIDEIRRASVNHALKTSSDFQAEADHISESVIAESEFGEFTEEAMAARAQTVSHLRELQKAAAEREAEAARLAEERARLDKERAEAAERERIAAVARAEQEARDRAERERVEAEQRAAREKAEAAMRAEREEHQRRMAVERAELAHQQAEIAAAKAEQERIEREAREAAEAEARARREAEETAAAAEADRLERERQAEAERAALAAEVARLHALQLSNDGLGMLEDVLSEIARPIGQECCGNPDFDMGDVCCGNAEPAFHTIDSLSTELNKWRNEIIERRQQKEAA